MLVAGALALAACDSYDADIEAVKRASTLPGKTNEELVADLAGARSTVEWSAKVAKAYKSDDIIEVTADINRMGKAGKHVAELRFIHNRQTKKVAFESFMIDGEVHDLVSGALNLFKLKLE